MDIKTLLLLMAALLVPIAPASVLSGEQPDRARLDERVAAYWDAIRIRDLATAYALELGSVDGTLTADAFRRRSDKNVWDLVEYKITTVEIDGEEARLELDTVVRAPQIAKPLKRSRADRWVFSKGDWYRAPAAPTR
ncbi:hypothetical protein [Thiocapsa marina]|uniref:DUF4440 domain-containing protein n=1 Tax=Thiocapsa marina 5811 TaxID=768671 RepID=F9U9C8_9GAMM|nr:hypothetical protein [Thiocapsa marina]EGV19386.1 hypothetical protein ThimaDRAFT_1530 [Thiocapsa marina 5811]